MSYNQDELEAPEWVGEQLLETILKNAEMCNNIKLISYKVTPGSQLGDHFASIIFRITLKYLRNEDEKAMSVILKTMPQAEGFKKDFLNKIDIFQTEQIMYNEVLPKVQTVLSAADPKNPFNFPRIFYSSLQPHKVIVFEDLKELGYVTLYDILSFSDLQLVIINLAKFHAASVKLASEGNTTITNLNHDSLRISVLREMDLFESALKLLKETIASVPEYENYAKKLEPFTTDILLEKYTQVYRNPGKYNVLNHGDFHGKNMMFKLNKDNSVFDLAFIDYQACHWGTPAIDLYRLLYMNPSESRENIIELYFNVFSDFLKKMNYTGSIPTLSDLQFELRNGQILDLFIFACMLPGICMDDFPNIDLEKWIRSSEYRSSGYKSLKYKKFIDEFFPKFMENGVFDL